MIGHADFHKLVPRDPGANVAFRLKALARAHEDAAFRSAFAEMAKRDLLFFANTLVWQYNPAKPDAEVGPWITFPKQEEVMLAIVRRCIVQRKTYVVEKSRELGATWFALIIQAWLCLFHRWKKCLDISHSADAVDRTDDPDCLFWKVRFLLDRMPDWLTQGCTNKKLLFNFSSTGSVIGGGASTGRSGVGGRASLVLLDEFGKMEEASDIWGQTADTGPRLVISTHYGVGTKFFELTRREDLEKGILHWSHHPDKAKGLYHYDIATHTLTILDNTYEFPADYQYVMDGTPSGGPFPGLRSPWYDAECLERGNARDVAMHLDIDAQGSAWQYFDPISLRSIKEQFVTAPLWEGHANVDPQSGEMKLVKRKGGPLRLWIEPGLDNTVPKGRYAVTFDVSPGQGRSPSVGAVCDAETSSLVGVFTDPHIKPDALADLGYALGNLFHKALVCWETNGAGQSFGKRLIDWGYSNIYMQKAEAPHTLKTSYTERPGWHSATSSKRYLLDEFKAAMLGRQFVVPCVEVYEEAAAFRWNKDGAPEHPEEVRDDDPSGAKINHGDVVIATALGWKMIQELGAGMKPLRVEKLPPPVNSLAGRRARRHNASQAWL